MVADFLDGVEEVALVVVLAKRSVAEGRFVGAVGGRTGLGALPSNDIFFSSQIQSHFFLKFSFGLTIHVRNVSNNL